MVKGKGIIFGRLFKQLITFVKQSFVFKTMCSYERVFDTKVDNVQVFDTEVVQVQIYLTETSIHMS